MSCNLHIQDLNINSHHNQFGNLCFVGMYKYDEKKNSYDFNPTVAGRYQSPSLPLDLEKISKSYLPLCPNMGEKKEEFEMGGVLKFLQYNPSILTESDNKIVLYRSTISKMMQMPVDIGELNENFLFRATKFRTHIYISHAEPCSAKSMRANHNRALDAIFKFNCISGLVGEDIKESLINPVQYYCVYERTLGDLKLLFPASIVPASIIENEKKNFVEIKLARAKLNFKFYHTKRKLLNWHCSYSIININSIYYGLLNKNGKVMQDPEKLEVAALPTICNNFWEPKNLISFLHNLLKEISIIMKNIDDPYTVVEFNFNSKEGSISWVELKVQKPEALLTDEFIAAQL